VERLTAKATSLGVSQMFWGALIVLFATGLDVFAEGHKFFDQLLTFERSPVHSVRDQDQAGNTVRGDSNRINNLEGAYRRLEVQAGRSTGDQHQL
jgi:hypothetical protein